MRTFMAVLDQVWLPAFLIFLLALPFLVIPAKRALQALLVRGFDRLRYREPREAVAPVAEDLSRQRTFFPLASVLSVAVPVCLFGLFGLLNGHTFAVWLGFVAAALGLLIAALYVNYSGRGTRRLKYDLVLAAMVTGFSATPLMQAPAFFGLNAAFLLLVGCPFFFAVQALTRHGIARIRSEQTAIRLYSYGQMQAAWLLSGFVTPLLPVLLLARFHLGQRLERRPILYFRSFGSDKSGPAFREIIAPAARRYGIIAGLAHRTQRVTDLEGAIDLNQQAHLSVLPDDRWQDWVRERLRVASLVIFDTTGSTAGMTWEIEQVLAHVSPERIAILYDETENDSFAASILQIRYSLRDAEPLKARAALEAWIRSRLLGPVPAAALGDRVAACPP